MRTNLLLLIHLLPMVRFNPTQLSPAGLKDIESGETVTLIFEKSPNLPRMIRGTYHLNKEKLRTIRSLEAIRENTIEFIALNEFNDEVRYLVDNYETLFFQGYPGHINYFFEPRDTVFFSYQVPLAVGQNERDIFAHPTELLSCKIINRKTAPLDYSYPLIKRAKDGLYFFESDEIKFKRHLDLLDSLSNQHLLTKTHYELHREALRFEYLQRFLQKPELFNQYSTQNDLKRNDLIPLYSYRRFLRNYLSQIILQKQYIKVSSGISPDFKKGYEAVVKQFEGRIKDFLLLDCVRGLQFVEETKVFNGYGKRLISDMNNTLFESYFNENYLSKANSKVSSVSILSNVHNAAKNDFKEVLASLKGKVVVVDLWASWCMPCRQAMPASRKMREIYKDQPIAFLYVSIDEDPKAWKVAARAENLYEYPHSFLLNDSKKAALAHQIKLESIPRYLVFDKDGVLVHKDAPGPDQTKEFRALIDKHLNK
jgi:thiol-disulfide isomerase/thioredoxin